MGCFEECIVRVCQGYENGRQPDWLKLTYMERNIVDEHWEGEKHARAWRETRKAVRAAKISRKPWKQREEGIAASLCGVVSEQ